MRFLSMIRVNETTGQVPTERLMNEMGQLIGELTKSGVLVDTGGLRPTAQGNRFRLRGGKISITDGPFSETKEVIGGYAIFKVGSKEEAFDLTRRFLAIHRDEWDIECELRQIEEPDFGG